jgi:hypothetical protein
LGGFFRRREYKIMEWYDSLPSSTRITLGLLRSGLYLGNDGKIHTEDNHVDCQPVTVILPIGFVLANRCHKCHQGDAREYEHRLTNYAAQQAFAPDAECGIVANLEKPII